jgi:hypothetical protein
VPGFSDDAKNTALDAQGDSAAWMSLHTGDPGNTGANEVSGGTYARVATTWSNAAGSSKVGTQVTINVPASTTVSYAGLWRNSSVYFVASNAIASGTLTVTAVPTVETNDGDAIVVAGSSSGNDIPTGVTDSAGNAYVLSASIGTASPSGWAFVCQGSAGLDPSDTITVTYAGTGSAKTVLVAACAGALLTGAVDQAVNVQGTSAAPSGTTGTLAQASEVAIALIINANAGGAPSGFAAGWAQLGATQHNGSTQFTAMLGQVTTANTALTASATIVSAGWTVIIVTLKAGGVFFAGCQLPSPQTFTSGGTYQATPTLSAAG